MDALSRRKNERPRKLAGFTIVELLIVVVIIAILAAITIVAYNGIQNRANDSVVSANLADLNKRLEMFKVDKERYPATTATVLSELNGLGFRASKGSYDTTTTASNLTFCFTADGSTYTVSAKSKSGKYYTLRPGEGAQEASAFFTACTTAPYVGLYQGYAGTDTTTGPWRAWVGGN